MNVTNMMNKHGNKIPNQFEIVDNDGAIYYQSYQSIIAVKRNGLITLDANKWDYSRTTGKYRNRFLGESKAETERKIKDGTYQLDDLN